MIKDVLKRQTTIVAVAVIGICLCLMGVSYAVFFSVAADGKTQSVSSGSLTVQFGNHNGAAISTATQPQNATDGAKNAYTFSVTNTGTLGMNYSVYLYDDPSAKAEAGAVMIPHQYLMVQFDSGAAKLLSTYTQETADGKSMRKLGTGSVTAKGTTGAAKTHTIRIWITEDAPESIVGNTVALQLVVLGDAA